MFRKSVEIKGCVVGGVNVNNLSYADDTVLITECEEDLQELEYSCTRNYRYTLVSYMNSHEQRGTEESLRKTKSMKND